MPESALKSSSRSSWRLDESWILDAAVSLHDLKAPPGNRLEALKDERAGQHSIRVNDQWRICFEWRNGSAHRVEIVDYH